MSDLVLLANLFISPDGGSFQKHLLKPASDPVVLHLLKKGARKPKEISRNLGYDPGVTRQRIYQLRKRGLVFRDERGAYRLTKFGLVYGRARKHYYAKSKKVAG